MAIVPNAAEYLVSPHGSEQRVVPIVPKGYKQPGVEFGDDVSLPDEELAMAAADRRQLKPRMPQFFLSLPGSSSRLSLPKLDANDPDLSQFIEPAKVAAAAILTTEGRRGYEFSLNEEGVRAAPPAIQALAPLVPQNQRPGESVRSFAVVRKT